MTITIKIEDSAASKELLQNVALARGWTGDDAKIAQLLGAEFQQGLTTAAKAGQNIAKRNAEQAELDASIGQIAVEIA